MPMKKIVPAVVLIVCLMGPHGFAHTKKLHCPPGEILKNVLLDTLTNEKTYKHPPGVHFSPMVLKINYHHYHWRMKMPFFREGHTIQQQAMELRNTVMGDRQVVAKKMDRYYYCHYPTLSKSISFILYTTLTHAMS